MRREHLSILTEVLDAMATCTDARPGELHITAVAARANLPHDRLKVYLGELADAGLVWRDWPCTPTTKGRQFLECYHAWLRLQGMFGLRTTSPAVAHRAGPAQEVPVRIKAVAGPVPPETAVPAPVPPR